MTNKLAVWSLHPVPLIPQETIDRILAACDIVDIINDKVPLKKTGANFKACCPFHQEKTPSFVVSPDKQIFHCFGCGVGGTVISFITQHEKLSFPEALSLLAKRAGIPLEKTSPAKKGDGLDELAKINAYAQWFFTHHFKLSQKAKDYAKKRHLTDDTLNKFSIGFAPDDFQGLTKYLTEKKIPQALSLKVGLIKEGKQSSHYSFFRDRLIFPIHNVKGQITGFGGRAFQDDEAKYINSMESPIYNKRKELYGLFQAKREIAHKDAVVIVEGYIDVLACQQMGIVHTVAPLGTSLTQEQVRQLKRYTSNFSLMFDGDAAGVQACLKAVRLLFAEGIHPKVVMLPKGDPADFLPDRGPELAGLVAEAKEAMNWLIDKLKIERIKNPAERAKRLKFSLSWLRQLPDPLERLEFEKKLCRLFALSPRDLEKVVDITYNFDSVPRIAEGKLGLEEALLVHFLRSPRDWETGYFAASEDFVDDRIKRLGCTLEDFAKKHETFDEQQAIQAVPEELQGLLSKLMLSKDAAAIAPDRHLYIAQHRKMGIKMRLKNITLEIAAAEVQNDVHKIEVLLKQKQNLYRELTETY